MADHRDTFDDPTADDVALRIGRDHIAGLPVPEEMATSPIFPFKGDIEVRTLRPFADTEHARAGEPGGPPCDCAAPPDDQTRPTIWANDRWHVRPIRFGADRAPFPSYMLGTAEHLDFEDFDDTLAAEYGVMCVRLDRAIRSLGNIARVHMNRWGDGGSHFHVWFLGRPFGAGQLSGFTMPLWGFILPPLPDDVHEANDRAVAAALDASEPGR
ncbi:MAG: hypothetical protein AAGA65_17025 [Actinomycetota bacterium]